jgi:cyclophilin family peptidyl-prolyl cis-trans isomerase
MNFLGEKGRGLTLYKKLYYKECQFHRVVKHFMIQSGDFTEGNDLISIVFLLNTSNEQFISLTKGIRKKKRDSR